MGGNPCGGSPRSEQRRLQRFQGRRTEGARGRRRHRISCRGRIIHGIRGRPVTPRLSIAGGPGKNESRQKKEAGWGSISPWGVRAGMVGGGGEKLGFTWSKPCHSRTPFFFFGKKCHLSNAGDQRACFFTVIHLCCSMLQYSRTQTTPKRFIILDSS